MIERRDSSRLDSGRTCINMAWIQCSFKFLAPTRSSRKANVCPSVCPWTPKTQLNTCTFLLSVCLSICLSQTWIFDSFWQHMTAYDSFWQLMTAFDLATIHCRKWAVILRQISSAVRSKMSSAVRSCQKQAVISCLSLKLIMLFAVTSYWPTVISCHGQAVMEKVSSTVMSKLSCRVVY